MQMTIDLPATLSEQEVREIKQDLAVFLYQRRAASLGKAVVLAGLTRIEFQRLLAQRKIPINYSENDVEADLATLRSSSQQVQEQTILERVDRTMERMTVQNAAYSDEEVAADIEAARKNVAA